MSMATMAAGSSSCEQMSYCAGKEGEVECIAAALGSEAKYTVGSGFVELAVMLPIDSTSPVRKALSSSSVMKAWDGTKDVPWPSWTFRMTLMIFSTCYIVSSIVYVLAMIPHTHSVMIDGDMPSGGRAQTMSGRITICSFSVRYGRLLY